MSQLTIGKFIAQKRKEKNLTQEQLAEILGVSNKTVSKWECGKCMPDYNVVQSLCDELGITIAELMDAEKRGITNPVSSSELFIELGEAVHLFIGERNNIKVTTPEDMETLRAYFYYQHYKDFANEKMKYGFKILS